MSEAPKAYLPAAGRDWALPFYDPFVKLFGGDAARKVLIDQAAVRPSQRILDIGCGTGTLAVQLKQLHPDIELTALDPDPKALARAGHKARRAGGAVKFDRGYSDDLPYPDSSFDRVFSSFMYHHLRPEDKEKTLREVHRVLRPGGSFHMLDFAGPESGQGFLAHFVHASHRLRDNAGSRILSLLSQAGFESPGKVGQRSMLFGRVAYYRAVKPAAAFPAHA